MANKVAKLTEFPLIEVAPSNMILPTIMDTIDIGDYPELLTEIRAGKIPYVFLLMSKPGENMFPDKFYSTGLVARVLSADVVNPEIGLLGEYRATLKSLRETEADSGQYIATIENTIDDEQENVFIERSGKTIIDPRHLDTVRGIVGTVRKRVGILLGESGESIEEGQTELLELIYKNFDSLPLGERGYLDQLIWHTIYAVPDLPEILYGTGIKTSGILPGNAPYKQFFLETTSLMNRIYACISLLGATIKSLRAMGLAESKSQITKTTGKNRGRKVPVKTGGSESQNSSDDETFSTNNPELQEKFKKYLDLKNSIKDEKERTVFREAAMRDFKKLASFEGAREGTETAMLNNRLDIILDLPWGKETPRIEDFNEFERIFENEVYGLHKIKDNISDYVAVRRNHPDGKGRVLCLVGPPGVGKTFLCRIVAKGLGTGYIRRSLGGVRDEAQIRGHRMTYIGALPGCVISDMKASKAKNVVYVLDEIDKLGTDGHRGNPADVLLEVLDPEQNNSFTDHYLDAPFDLSKVFFICTANTLVGIPVALRDRMDIILFSSYTEDEKVDIAKKFLVPKVLSEVGLAQKGFDFKWQNNNPDAVLTFLIRGFTREAGVRDLERKLNKIASRIVKNNSKEPGYAQNIVITEEFIREIYGQPREKGKANHTDMGEALGLTVDEVGQGGITYVQAKLVPKTGFADKSISQTDEAGESLRKQVQRAVSVAKIMFKDDREIMKKLIKNQVNTQVSDDFTPVDGPSAGITVFIALYSDLTEMEVRPKIAMTGALALTRRVKAVGGIKEKSIAAVNAQAEELILPLANKPDFEEKVPQNVKNKLKQVYFVERIEQVIEICFLKKQPVS